MYFLEYLYRNNTGIYFRNKINFGNINQHREGISITSVFEFQYNVGNGIEIISVYSYFTGINIGMSVSLKSVKYIYSF